MSLESLRYEAGTGTAYLVASTCILAVSLMPGYSYVQPDEITGTDIGEKVTIREEVESSYISSGSTFLDLESGLPAVQFNGQKRFRSGDTVRLKGRVTIYRGEPEIIVSQSELLDN
jgi:hypothetical protein